MHIIGFIGKIGSGKTEASNVLQSLGYKKYAFAYTLKKWGVLAGFTHKQMYGTQEEKLQINDIHGVSGREWLQTTGNIMRATYPGFWVNIAKHHILQMSYVVIEDVRYPDEAKLIKELGGVLVKIDRSTSDVDKKENQEIQENHQENQNYLNHESETAQDDITPDFIINNTRSLSDFKKEVINILFEVDPEQRV